MRLRKETQRKFYLPGSTEYWFEVRTLKKRQRERAISGAFTDTTKRPLTEKSRKKYEEADEEEVQRQIRIDQITDAEWGAAIAGFYLPGEDGPVSSKGMQRDQILDVLDMVDEDLSDYIDAAITVMQGGVLRPKMLEHLAEIKVTPEMLGINENEVEDPLVSGENA